MVDDSNLETYADPINYDLESGTFEPDGTILLELASQVNGPVLELGCGTGCVTIPLADRGIDMTGLELLPHMLEYAQNKAKEVPVKWICADVRSFQLALRYIMPQEMETLLYYNGFTDLARYGDWKGNPLVEDGYPQIYVCTHRDGREPTAF